MRIMIMIILEAGVEVEIIGEEKSLGPNLQPTKRQIMKMQIHFSANDVPKL